MVSMQVCSQRDDSCCPLSLPLVSLILDSHVCKKENVIFRIHTILHPKIGELKPSLGQDKCMTRSGLLPIELICS